MPMSVTEVKLSCRRCKTERTYGTEEEVPKRCPVCLAEPQFSPPATSWVRRKLPYLPLMAWVAVLPFSIAYGLLTRSTIWWWMFYVMALFFFGIAWLLVCVLLPWAKPHVGPFIIPTVKLPMEDQSPDRLIGFRVLLKLTEPEYSKRFAATIVGYKSVRGPDWKWRLYVLRLNPEDARTIGTTDHVLFHSQYTLDRKSVLLDRLMREYGAFSMRASMEDLLLNPESVLGKLGGRVYTVRSSDLLAESELEFSVLTVSAFGEVEPDRMIASPLQ